MVQLKDTGYFTVLAYKFIFQYLYGAVKRLLNQLRRMRDLNFNTYMVQLKDLWGWNFTRRSSIFQYLYGAVKRPKEWKAILFTLLFQYLYGAVKSLIQV